MAGAPATAGRGRARGVRRRRQRGGPSPRGPAREGHDGHRRGEVQHVDGTPAPHLAVDELTGLITATALVRPSKSLHEVDARSVRKKMKDKAFARGVSREDVIEGAQEMGVDLDEHIQFVIDAMRSIAPELGLAGADGAP